MRVATYMGYMSLGALLCAAMPSSARPQTSSANPAAPSQPAVTQNDGDWQSWEADRAQWQQNMERFRREMRIEAEQLRKQLQEARNSEWAQEAKAMAEEGRQKAQELRAEVEKEMAANGLANRAAMEEMGAQLRANAREYAGRAQDEAQQARQLFEQSPSVLQMGDDTGWLGVEIGEVTADEAKDMKLPETRGVLVSDVVDDGPAAKAGLKAKDVIMEYDGSPVEGTVQFRRLVRETPPGRTVNLTVIRDGHDVKLSVQVGDTARNMESRLRMVMPSQPFNFKFTMPEFMAMRTPTLGIEAEDLTQQLGEYFHVPGGEGVLIREVNADSPAAKAGLKAGDVITKVEGNAVKSLGELRDNLREKREQKSVALTIVREGAEKTVSVAIEPPPATHRTVIRSATM